MTRNESLKACPFCGHKAKFARSTPLTVRVVCTNGQCGGHSYAHIDEAEAAKRWNDRDDPYYRTPAPSARAKGKRK